jgi:enoyl-CoA hydratase
MTTQLVNYEVADGIATVTLNDPPMNAYTHEMMKDLDTAILEARFDNEVHVIVLTGHGEKFFCAGANVRMLSEVDPTYKYYFCLHANETLNRLEQTPKLVIAAINGHCVGGGLELALACDLRIARTNAGSFGFPEVNLGVIPGTGGTQRLTRLVGKGVAMAMMLEGDTFDTERALQFGLINQAIEAETRDSFVQLVHRYAQNFTPPNKASLAAGAIKRAVQSGAEMSLDGGLAFERELQARLFDSADANEGLNAFVQKRTPVFQGR